MNEELKSWDEIPSLDDLKVDWDYQPENPNGKRDSKRLTDKELIQLFVERIKEALEVPILDEWSVALWKQARSRTLVQDLTTGGDCILGARIDLRQGRADAQADWKDLLSELLAQEEISLTI